MEWKTLYLIQELTKEIWVHLHEDSDIFRFKMLPLIAVRAGHSWSNSPPSGFRKIVFTKRAYQVAWCIDKAFYEAYRLSSTWAINGNRWVLGMKFPPQYLIAHGYNTPELEYVPQSYFIRIAHPALFGLSLQLPQGTEMTDYHILSIATRVVAKSIPVMVAAGNWGQLGAGSLSPLARLPWTIAVGATSDFEGTKLHHTSSIGEIGSKIDEGVTVVAYGENPFVPGLFGTSYAVPRAGQALIVLTCFILQIRALEEIKTSGHLGGVPLLQYISVDKGFEGFDTHPSLPLPMIPLYGVNQFAVNSTLNILQDAGLSICIEPNPSIMRRMLIASAKMMDHYKHHEVGYGFVSEATTIKYLSTFTGGSLAELFIEKSNLDDNTIEKLNNYKLANEEELNDLYFITLQSMLKYSVDFTTAKIYASMRDPGLNPKETGFKKTPGYYTWPPKI
jgi:hypothetical protein